MDKRYNGKDLEESDSGRIGEIYRFFSWRN
jgi:hypothetical protein